MPWYKPIEKPLIAIQIDTLYDAACRTFRGEFLGLVCGGPHGVSKTVTIKKAAAVCDINLIKIKNATLTGIVEAFRQNPDAFFWIDDFDEWLTDNPTLNLFKEAFDKEQRTVTKINRDTHRDGEADSTPFNGRCIITSNVDFDAVPKSQQAHVDAMTDRLFKCAISRKIPELLNYIDWWVCEQDYFRTAIFRRDHAHVRHLSLTEIQDALNYIHDHASVMTPSLRSLNTVACERRLHPDTWKQTLSGFHKAKRRPMKAIPAPIVFAPSKRKDDDFFRF